eukprot:scaffold25410_cov112-Isochrysis_galbana.AAC.1
MRHAVGKVGQRLLSSKLGAQPAWTRGTDRQASPDRAPGIWEHRPCCTIRLGPHALLPALLPPLPLLSPSALIHGSLPSVIAAIIPSRDAFLHSFPFRQLQLQQPIASNAREERSREKREVSTSQHLRPGFGFAI